MKRQCLVKIGDLVRAKSDERFYGYVAYIDSRPSDSYFVEVIYDEDADSLYFYDDELEVLKVIKE